MTRRPRSDALASERKVPGRTIPNEFARVLSPRTVGGLNRARVLRALADNGPLSRSDLAQLAGVSRATIGTIVQRLIDENVLDEGAPLDRGSVGKPARPVWFAAGAGTAVALELRRVGVHGALVDARGSVFADEFMAFRDATSPADVAKVTSRLAADLSKRRPVIGVGIAVPGTVDLTTGEVVGSLQVPGAEGIGLVEEVRRVTELVTFVENDSRAQALAEYWFGLARGTTTFVSVQTGAGLSVGLVLDGVLFRGPHGLSGELGHTVVDIDGEPCSCGLRGCWETVASIGWMRRAAREAGISGARSMTCEKLQQLAERGDARARSVVEKYADNLAIGLANLRSLLGSDCFIIHGDAVGGGEPFRVMLNEATDSRALGPVRIVFSELGEPASLLGAAAVVLNELLHLPG